MTEHSAAVSGSESWENEKVKDAYPESSGFFFELREQGTELPGRNCFRTGTV